MNSSLYLIILKLCFTFTKTELVLVSMQDYVSLISDIHKLDKPTSITVLRFADEQSSNLTKVYEQTSWIQKRRYILHQENSLQRERDMLNGKVIRRLHFDSSISTMFAELMCSALEYAGNFTIKEVSTMNHSGLFNESTETRPGAISELVNDEADIISFVMEMTEERLKVYDFPVPKIMRIKLALMVNRRRNQRINIRSDYLKVSKEKINKYKNTLDSNSSPCLHSPFYLATENLPFTYETWWVILLILMAPLALLTCMKPRIEKEHHYGSFIPEKALDLWGILCQQGLPESKRSSLRIIYYTIFIFALFICSIFSACIVSELIIDDESPPFNSLEEFAKEKSYKFAVLNDPPHLYVIQSRKGDVWNEIKRRLLKDNELPETEEELVNLLCDEKVATYIFSMLKYPPYHVKDTCRLLYVHSSDYVQLFMSVRKNFPYLKAFNYYLLKMQDHGIINWIIYRMRVESIIDRTPTATIFTPLSISSISSLLTFYCGSVVLSLIALVIEKIYFYFNERKTFVTPTLPRPVYAPRRIRKHKIGTCNAHFSSVLQ